MISGSNVYIAVKRSNDCASHMVEICGVFSDRKDADEFREALFERDGSRVQIQVYWVE